MKNELNSLETVLRTAPAPRPPKDLAAGLKARISLPDSERPATSLPPFWKRWWPVIVPGGAAVAFAAIIVVQDQELRNLAAPVPSQGTSPSEGFTRSSGAAPVPGDAAQASGPGIVISGDQAELVSLRTRVANLNGALSQVDAMAAENARLEGEIEAAKLGLAPESRAILDAQDKATRIRCVNNMKQLGLAVRIHATDHNDEFPQDLKSILQNLGNPSVLVCPADTSRMAAISQAPESAPSEAPSVNTSYEFLSPGPGKFEAEPYIVMFRCPIHGSVTLCDGSVQQLSPEQSARMLVRRDGRLYLNPQASTAPVTGP